MKNTAVLFSIVAALALAACGKSSSDPGVTQQQSEDAAASASVPALVAFGAAQIARADADVMEPCELAGITPPVSDVDEPAAI